VKTGGANKNVLRGNRRQGEGRPYICQVCEGKERERGGRIEGLGAKSKTEKKDIPCGLRKQQVMKDKGGGGGTINCKQSELLGGGSETHVGRGM